jgi:hypothetical protein
MDNIEDIEKKVEDTQNTSIVNAEQNNKIAPTEPNRSYSSMSMPMTKFMTNAQIEDNTVSDEVTDKIQGEVNTALKDEKFVKKKSRKLAKVGNKLVEEEIKYRDNKASARRAQNKVDKQIIRNNFYIAKQEKKRATKEQRHLNKCQKETHKQEIADYRWKEYGDMLQGYGYKKTPSSFFFKCIVVIDGIARFLDGLNKVNNKLVKAMKWIIGMGVIVGAYFLIKLYL